FLYTFKCEYVVDAIYTCQLDQFPLVDPTPAISVGTKYITPHPSQQVHGHASFTVSERHPVPGLQLSCSICSNFLIHGRPNDVKRQYASAIFPYSTTTGDIFIRRGPLCVPTTHAT